MPETFSSKPTLRYLAYNFIKKNRKLNFDPEFLELIPPELQDAVLDETSLSELAKQIDRIRFQITDTIKTTIQLNHPEEITKLLNDQEIFQDCSERVQILIRQIKFLGALAMRVLHE